MLGKQSIERLACLPCEPNAHFIFFLTWRLPNRQ
jgi:hypothetical protein